jgi:hypothetical protein
MNKIHNSKKKFLKGCFFGECEWINLCKLYSLQKIIT